MNKRNINLLWIILFSLLLNSCTPLSNLLFGPSGSITLETYPSGASIWIDGKDTGLETPATIENLTKGEHKLKFVYGNEEYLETIFIYNKQNSYLYKELIPKSELWKITVTPPVIYMKIGEKREIGTISAIYMNMDKKKIPLSGCNISSESSCVELSNSGKITGISTGTAIITISHTEKGITKYFNLFVHVEMIPEENEESMVCRAFCVGIGDYDNFPDALGNYDLIAPPYDVDMMKDTLNHSGNGFASINELKDLQATKNAILSGIASTFYQADSDDVSYFYFSGHGMFYEGSSYLCPTDISSESEITDFISVNELEAALNAIPGTKVVFLDCCHSGGFIGKAMEKSSIADYPGNFNENVIHAFMKNTFAKNLATPQYQVLTSCLSSQSCLELTPIGINYGLFSVVLCEGCGFDYFTHPYYADVNANGEITLNEAYIYTDQEVDNIIDILNSPPYEWAVEQDTQVYPENSDFVIIYNQ